MTLIVTALGDDAVVQVSDRRLTVTQRGQLRVFTDRATKTINAECLDSHFCVSYTGLARLDLACCIRTDEWLVDELMKHTKVPLAVLLQQVATAATAAFSKQALPAGWDRRLTIVFAGFSQGVPFSAWLTNQEDEHGKLLQCAGEDFNVMGHTPRRNQFRKKLDIVIHGAELSLKQGTIAYAAMRGIARKGLTMSPARRAISIAQLIRLASKTPAHGRYIGEDCLGASVLPDGRMDAFDFPDGRRALQVMPHVVLAAAAFKDIVIYLGEASWEEFAAMRKRDT